MKCDSRSLSATLAAVATVIAGVASMDAIAAPPNPRVITQGVAKFAFGYVTSTDIATGVTTVAQVNATQLVNVEGYYTDAFVSVSENVNGLESYGWRYLQCPLEGTFSVDRFGAGLNVLMDSASPNCIGDGYLVTLTEGEWVGGPWGYTGTLTVSGTWTNPRYPFHDVNNGSRSDIQLGTTYKYTCQRWGGDSAAGSFSVGDKTFVMVNTVTYPDIENTGNFVYNPCTVNRSN